MRVLCLHPAASSALQLSRDFHKLEERLWEKHGIELVFVDGPLLDARVGDAVGEEGGGIRAIDEPIGGGGGGGGDDRASRRWYVEESSRRALPPTRTESSRPTSSPSSAVRYSGLDASLLHLSQIWTRGGANISNDLGGECSPFQGVMGIDQGADVAGLLPLLNHHVEDYTGDSDDEKENNNANDRVDSDSEPSMFQGMQFVILIDGKDIIFRGHDYDTGGDESENDVYVGPDGVQSLHVIMDNNNDDTRRRNSERLAKQYGPNATIHHREQSKTSCTPALSNIIGKFLVAQKNRLHSNSESRELMALQNRLSNVEQLAALAISQEVQRNPPKALMAVIGPATVVRDASQDEEMMVGNDATEKHRDVRGGKENVRVDKAVGAWQGARRRGFGEEGGGAPCPGQFLLREEER